MNTVKCEYCEKELNAATHRLTREHIIPKSKGGNNLDCNIAWVCSSCNHFKGSSLPYDFVNFLDMKIRHGKVFGIFSVKRMTTIRNNLVSILISRNIPREISNKKGWIFSENHSDKDLPQSQKYKSFKPKKEKVIDSKEKKLVGHLTSPIGLKDCHPTEIGHPVYEFDDHRYVIYLEKIKQVKVGHTLEVRYYKTSLKEIINFLN